MKLLTHLLAADARRFKLATGLWIVIVIAETVVQHVGTLVTPYTREAEAIATAGWLFWMSGLFVSCALVPLIVHLHPAVGSDAFWMTRPISPRTLVAAKLLLLAAVFVGVPLLADQFVMALYEVPGGDRLRVAAQTMIFRGVVLVLLMAAAALTPNFARFAVLVGGVLFALAVILPLLAVILAAMQPGAPTFSVSLRTRGSVIPFAVPPHLPTVLPAIAALLTGGGIATLLLQYGSRRVSRSAVMLAASVAIAMLAGNLWPSSAPVDVSAPEWAREAGAVELVADASAVSIDQVPPFADGRPRWDAQAPVRMTGMAAGWLAAGRLQHASLELDTGVRFSTRSDGYNVPFADSDDHPAALRALQHVLGVPYVAGATSSGGQEGSVLALHVLGDDLTGTGARAARFAGELGVDLTRLEIANAMPLARGRFQDGAYSFALDEVQQTPTGIIARGRATDVATVLDASPRPAYAYVLRNRRRNEAVLGIASHYREHLAVPLFSLSVTMGETSGFSVGAQRIVFSDQPDQRRPGVEMDGSWLQQAELVIVRAAYAGSVRRRLVIENFPVTPTPAGS